MKPKRLAEFYGVFGHRLLVQMPPEMAPAKAAAELDAINIKATMTGISSGWLASELNTGFKNLTLSGTDSLAHGSSVEHASIVDTHEDLAHNESWEVL